VLMLALNDSTTDLVFVMLDAFLTLITGILEQYNRESWNKLKAEHMVRSNLRTLNTHLPWEVKHVARKKTRARWGDGQIKQLGENKWLVRASGGTDADGRRIRPAKVVYGTRQAAVRALRKLQDELDAQTYIPPEDMTVGEWLREWFRAQWNAEVGDPESIRQSKYPLRTVETL